MHRMIVVDDEPLTRRGILNLTDWSALGVEICGEAEDGEKALILARTTRPDIILCDVRMPRMDGIHFMRALREFLPGAQLLFLSGYSDTEYLKSAIRLGAIDYIDKPFTPVQIIDAVRRAQRASSAQRHIDFDRALALARDSREGNYERLEGYNVRFDKPYFSLRIVYECMRNASDDSPETNGLASAFNAPSVGGLANAYAALAPAFDGKLIISSLGDGYLAHASGEPTNALDALSRAAKAEACFIGASCARSKPAELVDAVREAEEAARYAYLLGFGRALVYSDRPTAVFQPDLALERDILARVEQTDMAGASDLLYAYLAKMRACSVIEPIRAALERLASELCADTVALRSANTLDQAARVLIEAMKARLQQLDEMGRIGRLIYEVNRYVQKHAGEPGGIRAVAAQVYLSPTYLCYLYKAKTGNTLGDYITRCKMEKAKELLNDPRTRVGEVADQLGYANADYFSKLFAKQFGMTPLKYKSSAR